MLYHLLFPLHDKVAWLSFLRVLQYPTFRITAAFATALLIGLLAGPALIRHLRLKQKGISNTREDSPDQENERKKKTPTLGGLLILFALTMATLLFADLSVKFVWSALIITLGYGFTGWLDDYLKMSKRNSKGLPGRYKMILLTLFFVIGLWGLFFDPSRPAFLAIDSSLTLPFVSTRSFNVDIGWMYVLLAWTVIVGTSNAVNLTDGLDGLAAGQVVTSAALFTFLAYVAGVTIAGFNIAAYLNIPHVDGTQELAVFAAAVAGAGVAFLWFNAYPADVFMGDVGALALGGALGTLAVFTKNEFMSAIVHGVFLAEALSVMLQVTSFKFTGRRIFLMAPVHHHFQKLTPPWPEPRIVVRFWIVSIMLAIVGVASLKLR
jgi:phospho-N-acetylmuramoyl-pentapeptide-transferase